MVCLSALTSEHFHPVTFTHQSREDVSHCQGAEDSRYNCSHSSRQQPDLIHLQMRKTFPMQEPVLHYPVSIANNHEDGGTFT